MNPAASDDILAGLDPEQRDVATAPPGPVCVLAGAGTGKTRAITHRIAYAVHSGQVQPQRVLALTFTARAAGEMRTRLRQLGVAGVQARTFHSAALRQLHFFWPQAVGGAAPEILSQKASAVAEAAGRLRLQFDRTTIRDLAGEIEWAKVNLLDPASYVAGAKAARREPPGLDLTAMARLFEAYGEVLQRRGVIDFEDVLLTTVGILDERDDIARAVRGQYRSFVVDEYQDVNAVQQRLLDVWLGERDDLVVVGDPSQTIYSFTGASPRHLLGFTNRFPKAHVVRLVRNYRSTPQIVTLANTVIGSGPEAVRSGALRLVSEGAPGPTPLLSEHPDDPAEAVAVAERIRRLVDKGHPAAEIAVLFRINAQSEAFESALTDAGVPYLVRGGERFFARKEVRAAILLLRGAARGDDGEKPLGHLVRDVITGAGWAEQPPAGSGATRERWESLNALASEADNLAVAAPEARLPELVAELDRRAAEQHAPVVQGVTLASLHAAKGLEWDTVFIVGVSEGLLPISMAEGPDEIEEERRLLYVGLTRARRELFLSWSGARNPGGRRGRRVSRFLAGATGILGDGARTSATKASGGGRRSSPKVSTPRTCRGCGAELTSAAQRKVGRCDDCPPTYDEATFERLRAWRLAVAREASVPAYVVFTDATLTAIAESEPADARALSAISGVGARKLEQYADDVIAIMGGADPEELLEKRSDTSESAAKPS
ncbi:ATP-dependent DNA helicase [Humibacillus sp. DSM 29435]|uniref:ATP-dependent DNA helicase UvrD2 n=1 Tax=Humibacillus sp. DSM 29435 TaxID=1869167 RepID=UPI0008732C97|nr:ATP-dependent DNA helicase UvrD2 [Humibacillus sp. DSM 29435]OFE18073.1 ATP-dependent DNA helicase [Humibacillus sp. DSM 29435]